MNFRHVVRATRVWGAVAVVLLTPAICMAEKAAATVNDLPTTPSLGGEALKVAGILCLMLAFIFAGFWLLKRYGHRAGLGLLSQNDLKMEGQLALGPKKYVVVVRFLNKRMVLGVTDSHINLLTEMDAGHDDDSETDFTQSLEEARSKDRTP
ncbi:flagellar biosynthetic protein FliO [Desulfovibrio ferrophilus]|uniref:Flagellar protein n=1 Tax=Desulfovibrio ferrophilus TaxID=241368 RepID=A0A2Z6B1T7_9BACT|nr:flagellar biosynthetic protein FliO [Desulfovibrio ferrophilus]BBD09400.1 flagellar biosynthetic protein FliO [Desulfovibrio ferrophilus]